MSAATKEDMAFVDLCEEGSGVQMRGPTVLSGFCLNCSLGGTQRVGRDGTHRGAARSGLHADVTYLPL